MEKVRMAKRGRRTMAAAGMAAADGAFIPVPEVLPFVLGDASMDVKIIFDGAAESGTCFTCKPQKGVI